MLLAIDVGNTNTVFAVFKNDVITHSWRSKTEHARSADEYAVFLKQVFDLEKIQWSDIDNVIISSVVPDVNFHLQGLCQKYIKVDAMLVNAAHTDITVDLNSPDEIGADRLVNAVAVVAQYDLPAIVIDFGTATTFDVIDTGGVYRGGIIAPGIRLSAEALTSHAAKLPTISIQKPDNVIGKSTKSAMQSGIYWGYVGLIEGLIKRLSDEIGTTPYVIATGGLATLYKQDLNMIDTVDNDLILKGLLEIYKKQKE